MNSQNLKRIVVYSQNGFTFLEMMITVAILGVLASLSATTFSQYQARTKAVEARIQLASLYSSQEMFYNQFEFYSNCINHMGYEPAPAGKRFYAIGFPSITANIDSGIHAEAIKDGLEVGACPANLGPTLNETHFFAEKGIGGERVDTIGEFTGAITGSSSDLNEAGPTTPSSVMEGLGTSQSPSRQVFTAVAVGFIDSDHLTPSTASVWTIDSDKVLKMHREGY